MHVHEILNTTSGHSLNHCDFAKMKTFTFRAGQLYMNLISTGKWYYNSSCAIGPNVWSIPVDILIKVGIFQFGQLDKTHKKCFCCYNHSNFTSKLKLNVVLLLYFLPLFSFHLLPPNFLHLSHSMFALCGKCIYVLPCYVHKYEWNLQIASCLGIHKYELQECTVLEQCN